MGLKSKKPRRATSRPQKTSKAPKNSGVYDGFGFLAFAVSYEHRLEWCDYWGELHIVCISNVFSSISQAISSKNSIAVLAFFIDRNKRYDKNLMFEQLLAQSPKLWKNIGRINGREVATAKDIPIDFSVMNIVRPDMFYRYSGSLTTPPCTEGVSWTIFMDPIPIHPSQANDFNYLVNIYAGEKRNEILFNSRQIQKLNKRTVYSSVKSSSIRHRINLLAIISLSYFIF